MDYFDEMGWTPIDDPEEVDNHQMLLVARFLRENGFFGDNFDANRLAPPASKEFVKNLEEKKVTKDDEKCTICLKPNTDDEEMFKVLTCRHSFHNTCILPWLERVYSSYNTILTFSFLFYNLIVHVLDKFMPTL